MTSSLSALRACALAAAALLAGLAPLAGAGPALAQLELKVTAPAAPGGGWDQTARALGNAMTAAGIARSVQVANVPGAGGTIGLAQFVNGARGDGNQLLVNGLVMMGAVIANGSPVGLDAMTPIARLTGEHLAVAVPANSPLKSVKDLVDAVRADPAKVRWAGGSAGGVDHIAAGLFAKAAGADATKINYVPFSGGGEALAALLGGRVTAGISGIGEFEGQVKSGKLRLLAVTAPARIAGLDAPTLKEGGLDLAIVNWRSVFAPPGITPEQRRTLLDAVDRLAKSPQWAEVLKQKGWDDAYLPGDAFAAFLKEEGARVRETLTSIGLVKG